MAPQYILSRHNHTLVTLTAFHETKKITLCNYLLINRLWRKMTLLLMPVIIA